MAKLSVICCHLANRKEVIRPIADSLQIVSSLIISVVVVDSKQPTFSIEKSGETKSVLSNVE